LGSHERERLEHLRRNVVCPLHRRRAAVAGASLESIYISAPASSVGPLALCRSALPAGLPIAGLKVYIDFFAPYSISEVHFPGDGLAPAH
jgi:hypothetical protein